MKTIQLDDYSIFVGSKTEFWEQLRTVASNEKYSRKVIVMDENTKRNCLPVLQKHIAIEDWPMIEIQSGEEHKTIETCQYIWSRMMELQLDRKTLIINLGGGVIGDMAGFCAATYKRGLPFIQLPTTLLSQVDASIGGKLGIDFKTVKNTIGLFRNPEAVFISPIFLKTLPKAELKSGYSEVLKHALIGDELLWEELQRMDIQSEEVDWPDIIHRSLLVKKEVVAQDPFEGGLRKILNFGHTIGHALESHALEGPQPLLHGEAIAVGMICESWLAYALEKLSEKDFLQMAKILLPQTPQQKIPVEDLPQLIALMQQDKKNESGIINFSIVPKPGEALFNITAPVPLISESLHRYNALLS